jgi:predicted MFS family arabinose efflux permease
LGAAGSIVAAFGYNAAFLTLGAVAVIALLVMVVAMPETSDPREAGSGTLGVGT